MDRSSFLSSGLVREHQVSTNQDMPTLTRIHQVSLVRLKLPCLAMTFQVIGETSLLKPIIEAFSTPNRVLPLSVRPPLTETSAAWSPLCSPRRIESSLLKTSPRGALRSCASVTLLIPNELFAIPVDQTAACFLPDHKNSIPQKLRWISLLNSRPDSSEARMNP